MSSKVCIVGLACCLVAGAAFGVEWQFTCPQARHDASVVVDSLNQRAVLFGGAEWYRYYNDVWEMPLDSSLGYRWHKVTTSGTPPSGRWSSAVVYDPVGQRLVVFGGFDATGAVNDLWELDLATYEWRQLSPSGGPPAPRGLANCTYAPNRRSLVVYGGSNLSGAVSGLWELRLDSLVWRELTPSGSPPSARWAAATCYDDETGSMFLVCGVDGSFLNEVWQLDLTPGSESWTELSPSGTPPSGRSNCAVGWCEAERRLFLFAGFMYDGSMYFYNDLYYLDLSGPTWHQMTATGDLPFERRDASGVFDPYGGNLFVFGGNFFDGDGYMCTLGDMVYIHLTNVAVGEWRSVPAAGQPWLQVLSPARAPFRLRYGCPDGRDALLQVCDVSGRVVRTLARGAGAGSAVWDGMDDAGHSVAFGTYFVRLTAGDVSTGRKLVLVE